MLNQRFRRPQDSLVGLTVRIVCGSTPWNTTHVSTGSGDQGYCWVQDTLIEYKARCGTSIGTTSTASGWGSESIRELSPSAPPECPIPPSQGRAIRTRSRFH